MAQIVMKCPGRGGPSFSETRKDSPPCTGLKRQHSFSLIFCLGYFSSFRFGIRGFAWILKSRDRFWENGEGKPASPVVAGFYPNIGAPPATGEYGVGYLKASFIFSMASSMTSISVA